MVKYALCCEKGHKFDEWFSSFSDYDEKKEKQELVCPICGSKKVKKAIMAPSVSTSNTLSSTVSKAGKSAQEKFGYCEGASSCPAFGSNGCGCS